MTYISVTMPNVDAFVEKLKSDSLLGREWADSLRDIAEMVEKRAKERAPIGIGPGVHGSIPAAISMSMDSRPVPTFAKVSLADLTKTGKNGKPIRYAGILQGSRKTHYRMPGRLHGKPTRKWFSGAVSLKAVEKLLQTAAERIEGKWSR